MTATRETPRRGALGVIDDDAASPASTPASREVRARAAAERLRAAIDEFAACVTEGEASDPGLLDHMVAAHQTVSRMTVAEALLVERLESSGRWRGSGARSLTQFVAVSVGSLPASARRVATLGAALARVVPAMGRAALFGDVDVDHARMTGEAATATEARREVLAREVSVEVDVPIEPDEDEAGQAGEAEEWAVPGVERVTEPRVERMTVAMTGDEYLAMVAGQLRARDFRVVLSRWVAAQDPAGLEESYRAAEEREHVLLARTTGGWHLEGFLSPKTGQALYEALEAVHAAPAREDRRTAGQRRAQDLAVVVERFLAKGLGGQSGTIRAQLAVRVSYETLQRLTQAQGRGGGLDLDSMIGAEPAEWADGSGPIPHSLLAQLACDSAIARYVFGPANEIINYGREKRFFNRAQRRALANRDGGCVFPGCTAPALWCDAHHTPEFDQDGATDLGSGALLCPFHHRYFHAHSLTMRRDEHGTWHVHRPSGAEISAD